MAKYETMLVTSSALDEEASAALIGKFKSLIEGFRPRPLLISEAVSFADGLMFV